MQIHLGPWQQLEPIDPILRTGCGHRLDRRLAAGRKDGPFPGSFGLGECSSQNHRLQQQPFGQFYGGHDARKLSAEVPGKMQFGSAGGTSISDGMEEQLKTLANLGLLSRFVGMLTDSRSFLSFPATNISENSVQPAWNLDEGRIRAERAGNDW